MLPPIVTPLSAAQTLERARSLLESGRGAALPELLKLIETLSLDISVVTIPELAEVIEKDAVVLARVLSVANMLAHNPGVAPLTTLSQAIHQLGYTRIRNLAVSLMLLDTAGSGCTPEQSEAAVQALCAGLMAQGAAEELGTHDGELVFACASLRNFGRIIMAAISPEHTREAQKLVPQFPLPEALRRLYGLTPIELSRGVLARSRLPEEVLRTFRDCEPESLHGVSSTYDARLLGIADFGCRLSELTLDARDGADAFNHKLATLALRFEKLLPGAQEITTSVLERADHRLRSFSRGHGTRPLPSSSLSRIARRLERRRPDPEAGSDEQLLVRPAPARLQVDLESSPTDALIVVPPAPPPEAAWETALTESHAFATQKSAPTSDPLITALTLISATVKSDACWLFQRSANGSFSPTRIFGDDPGVAPSLTQVRSEERTVFGVCASRQEVVVLHNTSDPTIRRYLPAWWGLIAAAPHAFALIPILESGQVTAMVVVCWRTPRRVELHETHVALTQQACANAIAGANRASSRIHAVEGGAA